LALVGNAEAAAVADPTNQVETVRFADPRLPSVRVVRGVAEEPAPKGPKTARRLPKVVRGTAPPSAAAAPPKEVAAARPLPAAALAAGHASAASTELVSFGTGRGDVVRVLRGAEAPVQHAIAMPQATRVEPIRFAGIGGHLVNIVRGVPPQPSMGLFGAAKGGELDRVAFAVDGAESGHGSNLAMWRAELSGPQGPMQVSAAAALDVGGGDRFDVRQNRLLGRAYLALLYQRYGNWPDSIAAYNWGPGNLDQWIAAGRPVDRLPLETARYLLRVLREALLTPS
jgi:transglycosylase-like protein with SLT domain